jgi:hypothetical protein
VESPISKKRLKHEKVTGEELRGDEFPLVEAAGDIGICGVYNMDRITNIETGTEATIPPRHKKRQIAKPKRNNIMAVFALPGSGGLSLYRPMAQAILRAAPREFAMLGLFI